MADTVGIAALDPLAALADGDLFATVDVSETDTTMRDKRTTASVARTYFQQGAATLDSSGRISNATAGIYLGTTANPGTGSVNSSNLLDDYEEGSWTPAFGIPAAFPSADFNITSSGAYTKIGNRVFIDGYIIIDNMTNATITNANQIQMSGLPFNQAPSGTFRGHSVGIFKNELSNSSENDGGTIHLSDANFIVFNTLAGAPLGYNQIAFFVFGSLINQAQLAFSINYITDS